MDNGKKIKGDFTKALDSVIVNLIEGKKSHRSILYEWDSLRGSDWYTSTYSVEERKLQKRLNNIS